MDSLSSLWYGFLFIYTKGFYLQSVLTNLNSGILEATSDCQKSLAQPNKHV